MKKSIQVLLVFLMVCFSSCSKEESISEKLESQDLTPLARAMSFFNSIEETDPADATFIILGQSSFVVNPTVLSKGILNFGADENLKDVNIGDIMFNNVLVKATDNYNKSYDQNQLVQLDTDIRDIFGKDVTVQNINCSGSQLCNFNFIIPMIDKFKKVEISGLINQYFIQKSRGFTLTWDASAMASDEIVGVVIVEANQNAKVGTPVKSFYKLSSTNNQVSISQADLNDFDLNSEISVTLVKGKSFTEPHNNKKVRVIAADIMHFGYTLN